MKDTGFLPAGGRQRLATLYTQSDGALVPNFSDEYRYKPEHRYESGGGGLPDALDMDFGSRRCFRRAGRWMAFAYRPQDDRPGCGRTT